MVLLRSAWIGWMLISLILVAIRRISRTAYELRYRNPSSAFTARYQNQQPNVVLLYTEQMKLGFNDELVKQSKQGNTTQDVIVEPEKQNQKNETEEEDFGFDEQEELLVREEQETEGEFVSNNDQDNDDDEQQDSKSENKQRRRLCTREEIINGKWSKELLERPPYITPTIHLRCFERSVYNNSPYKTYKWIPRAKKNGDCEFKRFSTKRFCKLVKHATIAIVGDSLSWEQFSSLMQLTGRKVHQTFQHQSLELGINIVQHICKGQTALIFRRDDKLRNLTEALELSRPNILILNRGAHFDRDHILEPEIRKSINQVRQWLASCRATKRPCHFFWRTSVPGMPNCGNYTEPLSSLAEAEAAIANPNNYNEKTIQYHWYDYRRQNELILNLLQDSGIPHTIIDGYYLNVLRPDEHRFHQGDCLHNCYPGKMDVYNQLLYHYLRDEKYSLKELTANELPSETKHNRNATFAAKEVRLENEKKNSALNRK